MRAAGATRPRWFDPVVASNGRRLTLGNWLLTTAVAALLVAPVLTGLGGSLFGSVLMSWLDIHDKDAIVILFVYVIPSTSVFGFGIAFYVRLLLRDAFRRIYSLFPILIFTITQSLFYLFFSDGKKIDEFLEWDPGRANTWAFIISSNFLVLLTLSYGLRKYSIFRIRPYVHVSFPCVCLLFGIADSLLFVARSGSDAAFITVSVAIYISVALVAALAIWLSFARGDVPRKEQPATGPKG
ncbi:MAG: hypothetical protein ACTS10_20375 [Kiloniellales bacterium]